MFYQPGKSKHNLPFDPFKACIVPRPIGWISTTSPLAPASPANPYLHRATHNLAPYSQFAQVNFDPPYVLFSANQNPHAAAHHASASTSASAQGGTTTATATAFDTRKDTVRNIEATGKFAWNLATWDLREAVNITAQQVPPGDDEFVRAGLKKAFTTTLPGDDENPVPMVEASPVRFECVHQTTLRLPGNGLLGTVDVVVGRVVAVHIADWALNGEGRLDVAKTRPIARCGYYQYAVVGGEGTIFDMVIPGADEVLLAGLEGSQERVGKYEEEQKKGKEKL